MPFAPVLTSTEIRNLEQAALNEGLPLMQRAGAAAAAWVQQLLGQSPERPGRRVLIVAGPGNNGGDAFECAWRLKQAFLDITVVFAGERARLPPDAQQALGRWEAAGGTLLNDIPAAMRYDLVVDGLFGIGLSRPLSGAMAALVQQINALAVPVLALDVPSGLNADTGAVLGAAIRATHTLTFLAHKPGLFMLDGPDHCGEVRCDALGTNLESESESRHAPATHGALLDASVLEALPRRPAHFHKGLAGDVGVIGGAAGMVGAALIAGRAALRTGAGRVFLGLLANGAPAVDFAQPELMLRSAGFVVDHGGVLLLGPGMGTAPPADSLLQAALSGACSLVLDADALNLLAAQPALMATLAARNAPGVLTPHPAEAARLLGTATTAVQRDRLGAALTLADRCQCTVVLKGNGSLIAEPAGRWWLNPTGNPGMASAGMGDALGGILASLIAQRMPVREATLLAVWGHGAAADELLDAGRGPLGITASDVILRAQRLFNRALRKHPGFRTHP